MPPRQRQTLLAVDEDVASLRQIEVIASKWFKVVTTRSPQRALSLLRSDAGVCVMMSEFTLAHTSGMALLKAARAIRPETRRIMMVGPENVADAIEGVRSGAVGRVVYKPLTAAEIMSALSLSPIDQKRATA